MFHLNSEFFQWEQGRYLEVNPESNIIAVEFSNDKIEGLVSQVIDGIAIVPSELLQYALPITALGYIPNKIDVEVAYRKIYKVLKRKKPAGYTPKNEHPYLFHRIDGDTIKIDQNGFAYIARVSTDVIEQGEEEITIEG